MKTLELFCKDLKSISTVTTWYIADLAEYRGKQELYIHQAPQNRNKEEVAGYRKVLTLIHENHSDLPICEQTIKKLHALTRGEIWDAGKYKEKNSAIVEKSPERNLVPKLGLI